MITIRKAVIGDEQALFGMAKQFEPAIYKLNESDFLETFRDLLSRDNMYLAVAIDQSEIIGYLLGSLCPAFHAKVARIEEMGADCYFGFFADPISPLISAFEEWAKDNGCQVVKKCTSFGRSGLFDSLGYEKKGFYYRKLLKS